MKENEKNEIEQLTKRIDELETQMAFQEQVIDTLNETITKQQVKSLEHEKMIKLLAKELEQMQQSGGSNTPKDDVPPPHY